MTDVVFFPGGEGGPVARIGGKAASLVWLCDAGFDVPPGAVLTVGFFEPWLVSVQALGEWRALVESGPNEWPARCDAVKRRALTLPFDDAQRAGLATLARLPGERFAVRSSSPDEDLGVASFAGGYETRLGVARDGLEEAVRACFASCLDARVLVYKREHGFDPFAPRIAVIVQQQVDSEVAGVAFSVNPLTNDYDEAVFDASWGLGESVVSGAVTPDHFVVDKVDGGVLSRELGAKQTSLHVAEDGPRRRRGHRSDELCLTDAQLAEATRTLTAIEAARGEPVDVELAWADGRLHVLQARPITAWVPLHPSMQTRPGERRRLYMDAALSGGLATNAPLSPFGESFFERFAALMIRHYVGALPWTLGPGDEVAFLRGGRLYAELSNVLWLVGPKLIARNQEGFDDLMAASLRAIDRARYRAKRRPVWVSPWSVVLYLRAVWRARTMLANMVRAVVAPDRFRVRYDAAVARFAARFADVSAEGSVTALLEERGVEVIDHVLGTLMPGLLVAMLGTTLAAKVVPKHLRALGERLERGFEGNVVVDMSIALHRMSKLLDPADMEAPERLAARLEAGELPDAFLTAWRVFLAEHGWRGPHEVDAGQPRYADAPILALRQMCGMARSDFDPGATHATYVEERRAAHATLTSQLGLVRRALLRRAHLWIDRFMGTRDTPKHQYLMLFAAARERAVRQGEALAAAGRLDAADHVFDLRIEDVERAEADLTIDLRALRLERTAFVDRLRAVVKGFPPIIDSRGRIIRPARGEERPGEVSGMPISPGVVRGPAKTLLDPHSKPIEPGDVLIAYTTDPGWTPLFVNAAAVVLEVGGVLQHGAGVAREYGKPCVCGIEGATERLRDLELVEVDG
ncbi:MAG: hypothetical protein KC619_35010, partial [Myxococcales bacterium]|nr:hypothetical protein [Myxococcales bacterium]